MSELLSTFGCAKGAGGCNLVGRVHGQAEVQSPASLPASLFRRAIADGNPCPVAWIADFVGTSGQSGGAVGVPPCAFVPAGFGVFAEGLAGSRSVGTAGG